MSEGSNGLAGVFLANADDSFVMATYQTIASQYQQLSDAPFLLTAYNLGYCIALPVVSLVPLGPSHRGC